MDSVPSYAQTPVSSQDVQPLFELKASTSTSSRISVDENASIHESIDKHPGSSLINSRDESLPHESSQRTTKGTAEPVSVNSEAAFGSIVRQAFANPIPIGAGRSRRRSLKNVAMNSLEGFALSFATGAHDLRNTSDSMRSRASARRSRILSRSPLLDVGSITFENPEESSPAVSMPDLHKHSGEHLNSVIRALDILSIPSIGHSIDIDKDFDQNKNSAQDAKDSAQLFDLAGDGTISTSRMKTQGQNSSDEPTGILRQASLYSNPVDVTSMLLRVKAPYLRTGLPQTRQSAIKQFRAHNTSFTPLNPLHTGAVAHDVPQTGTGKDAYLPAEVPHIVPPLELREAMRMRNGVSFHVSQGFPYQDSNSSETLQEGSEGTQHQVQSGNSHTIVRESGAIRKGLQTENVSDDLLLQLLMHSARPDIHRGKLESLSTTLKTKEIVDSSSLGDDVNFLWSTASTIPPNILPATLFSVEQSLRMLNKGQLKTRKDEKPQTVSPTDAASEPMGESKQSGQQFHLTTAKAVELASTWSTTFNSIYSHIILQLPRLVLEAIIEQRFKVQNNPDSHEPSFNMESLDVQCFIANNILSVLQGMLSDMDVLNLAKETIALRIQETIARSLNSDSP